MKINFQNRIAISVLLIVFQFSLAQKKQENIGTEVVNVVKPYTPTISDAFKVKETPSLDDEETSKKEIIKYSIFPFPVASTFTPSKGNAEGVDKEEQGHLFKNYATFGGGNYGTLNAELFVTEDLNSTEYVAGKFRHLSSQGGIKDVELENAFFDTSIDVAYGSNDKDMSWSFDLGYQNQIYNWYGLPTNFASGLSTEDRAVLMAGIKPQQSYNTISVGGKIGFDESLFNDASIKFNHFSDAYGSSENRFYVKPSFQLDVMDQKVLVKAVVDYLGGSFKKEYWNTNTEPIKYGFSNFGIVPSFVITENDWTLNIGAGVFYSMDSKNNDSKFLIYPQINASYKVVSDLMIFYAGAEGDLKQNTYLDFVAENPFVSPTLYITPTDKQYDVFAGLKGKLADNVSYNMRASYINERNKALFKSNDYTVNSSNEDYAFGNSLQVVYDDMKTLSFFGELKADVSENVTFGINGTFNNYTNKVQSEAWNLPKIKLSSTLNYTISPKWYVGTDVFYVGERKDQKINMDIVYIIAPNYVPVTLKSYFDVNAHVGFKYSDQLTTYLRANNITNQAYERSLNYPVQGFQIVIGANYKFDF
jgi:hypothetical protein